MAGDVLGCQLFILTECTFFSTIGFWKFELHPNLFPISLTYWEFQNLFMLIVDYRQINEIK